MISWYLYFLITAKYKSCKAFLKCGRWDLNEFSYTATLHRKEISAHQLIKCNHLVNRLFFLKEKNFVANGLRVSKTDHCVEVVRHFFNNLWLMLLFYKLEIVWFLSSLFFINFIFSILC